MDDAIGNKQVRVVFDNEWAGQIEMILLAPRVVHLIPGEENMIPGLYDASIFLENHMVYFYDSDIKAIMDGYEGTYFKAMGMRVPRVLLFISSRIVIGMRLLQSIWLRTGNI